MSIVIANLGMFFPYMLGDTLLTEVSDSSDDPSMAHCLKTHILNKDLCVGFAGSVEPALEAIAILYKKITSEQGIGCPHISLFNIWTEISKNHSLGRSEFVLIWKSGEDFKGAHVSESIKEFTYGCIGYDPAFTEFSRIKSDTKSTHNYGNDEIQNRELEKTAFKELLDSKKIPTIGHLSGFPIAAEYDSEYGFMFPIAASMSTDLASGTNHHSVCTTISGRGAIGIYYSGANVGYLFISGEISKAKKIVNVTFDQFIIRALADFGISLVGDVWRKT